MKNVQVRLVALAASLAAFPAISAEGPYVGIKGGINRADDQSYEFAGQSTLIKQGPIVVELPLMDNSGNGGNYDWKQGYAFGWVLGYQAANGLRPEFELSYRRDEPDSVTNASGAAIGDGTKPKLSSTSGFINLWYDVFPSWKLRPYLGGGVGFTRQKVTHFQTDSFTPLQLLDKEAWRADDTVLAYQYGAGINWDLGDSITVGLDYRWVETAKASKFYAFEDQPQTHFDAKYKAQTLFLSAYYYFSKPKPPPPPVEPAPAAVVAPPPDADGDGVPDERDQCPNTPAGTQVDDKGCPLAPPCKTPEAGERVSLAGCGTGDVIVLRGVNFEFDKSRLTQNAKIILDGVADELVANPQIKIELSGHTDAKGSDEYNQKLSESRARSVLQYLSEKGVASDRMTAAGYGESKPIADNETDEGRELNRRVELRVVGTDAVATGAGDVATVPAAEPAAAVDAAPLAADTQDQSTSADSVAAPTDAPVATEALPPVE